MALLKNHRIQRARVETLNAACFGCLALLALSCNHDAVAPNRGAAGSGPIAGSAGSAVVANGGTAEIANGGTAGGGAANGAPGGSESRGGAEHSGSGGVGGHPGGQTQGGAGGNGQAGGDAGAAGSADPPAVCPFSTEESFLWPEDVPGSTDPAPAEVYEERSNAPALKDRVIRGVSKPSLFPSLAEDPNGAAAIILPGGGYGYLTFDKEGLDIASWLNAAGVSTFVLKYRLPADFSDAPWIPLADAQRALRTVRLNAEACGVDPARIGVIGFSAGGHLASQLVTRFAADTSQAQDEVDVVDARPSFGLLIYPVISMDDSITHAGSKNNLLGPGPSASDVTLYSSELQVTSDTPPTFLAHSKKDTAVVPENSVRFDDALAAAAVAHELRLYEDGGHGVGIRNATGDMAAWPMHAVTWLSSQGLIPPP